MLLIHCPWCADRAQIEFTYGGDATVERPPNPADISLKEWLDYVYLRNNPRGLHTEWWHHSSGCRRWFKVRRDTLTHKSSGSAPPRKPLDGDGS